MPNIRDTFRPAPQVQVPRLPPPPPPPPPVRTTLIGLRTDGFQNRPVSYTAISGGQAPLTNQQLLQAGLEPEWLQKGTRPPFISAETWKKLPISERNATLADCRQGLYEHLNENAPPQWVADGTRPPNISEQAWQDMGIQERNAYVQDARNDWRAAMQEEIGYYFGGVPDGGARLDHPFQATGPGMWGQGTAGELAASAAHPADQHRPSQYINPRQLMGDDNYVSAHYKLCGQLAVGSMMGLSPSEALRLYADTGYDGLSTGATTGYEEIVAMIEQKEGWSAENVTGTDDTPPMTPEQMDAALESGQGIIALVNIDSTDDVGMLRSLDDSETDVAHWVRVMDVTTNPNGETYVRVYNPFQNSEELYSWDDFTAAWQSSGGNQSHYRAVVATPP